MFVTHADMLKLRKPTGFLTSPELFYVRNHGPVPVVRDEEVPTWELSIEGLVRCSFAFSSTYPTTFRRLLSWHEAQ